MDFIAIILASGYSKRFGENKLLYDMGDGFTLIDHVFNALELCTFKARILVSSYDEILNEGIFRNYIPVKNDNPSVGKSNSVKLGTELAHQIDPSAHLMFFVADQPNMDPDLIITLQEEASCSINSIVYPTYENTPGNPVIFPPTYYQDLMSLEGEEGGMKIAKANLDKVWEVEVDNPDYLKDIDTKEDL